VSIPVNVVYASGVYIAPGLYRHYKGDLYAVLALVQDSTNSEQGRSMVLYYSLAYGLLRVRWTREFIEPVVWPDGSERPRFERVTDGSGAPA